MPGKTETKGKCLCGAVGIVASAINTNVGACHCNMCRKWGGGPLMAVDCGTGVSFSGEEHLTVYDSTEWAERGFCSKCGTHIFYRLKESRQHIIPAGLLDCEDEYIFDHQIFIDEQPKYYCFSNKTENMTGAEVFAKFGSPE